MLYLISLYLSHLFTQLIIYYYIYLLNDKMITDNFNGLDNYLGTGNIMQTIFLHN